MPLYDRQNEIFRMRKAIQARIKTAERDLAVLQTECDHPNGAKTRGANTGNYDPGQDRWWIDFNCPDCLRSWRVYI